MTTIGAVTRRISTWNPSKVHEPSTFRYIDLSAVDNDLKAIVAPTQVLSAEAPSRARQIVATGDVLVSTVRPNLNAVAVVPPDLDGATASTGFTVLRPTDDVLGRYLFHWVRSDAFVADMVRKATGASYPAVSDRIVRESQFPLPPLGEQRRVAAILDRADALRAKRRQALACLDELPLAILLEMFGSPDDAVDRVPFGEVARLSGGRNLVADDAGLQSPYRVLKISAVTTGRFKPHESKPLPAEYVPPNNHLVRRGDLLMSRANTTELVGAVALVHDAPENLALPDKIWKFDWHDADSVPAFYHALFRTPSVRRQVSRLSSGTGGSMKNVSKEKLETMLIPDVPTAQQRQFAKRVDCVASQRALAERAIFAEEELFASLQSKFFGGKL